MVKMFRYIYSGESNKLFTNEKQYIGRINKDGDIFVLNDRDYWSPIDERRMTINRIKNAFKELEVFFVGTHKEAIAFRSQ